MPPLYDAWRTLLGDVELVATMAQVALCIVLSLRLVLQHRRRVVQSFSNMEKVSLDWLRNVLVGTLIIYGLWFMEEVFSADLLGGRELLDVLLGLAIVLLIYALGWLGLRQPLVFTTLEGEVSATGQRGVPAVDAVAGEATAAAVQAPTSQEKYARSALSPELAEVLIEELRALMENEKPYLNTELSLAELAQGLSVSTNYLSQAINQQTGQNFFDYVAHTLPALAEGKAAILSIAMDAGFNSKSAFYAAFRKHQRMTPGAYRKAAALSQAN